MISIDLRYCLINYSMVKFLISRHHRHPLKKKVNFITY